MDPITATVLLLMVTALVIGLAGRRFEQTSIPLTPTSTTRESQSGGGASGVVVILGIVVMLFALLR
jgi:hypothetical protein